MRAAPGAISATLGIVIIVWPTATVAVVFIVSGITAMLTGLVWISASFAFRKAPELLRASPR